MYKHIYIYTLKGCYDMTLFYYLRKKEPVNFSGYTAQTCGELLARFPCGRSYKGGQFFAARAH